MPDGKDIVGMMYNAWQGYMCVWLFGLLIPVYMHREVLDNRDHLVVQVCQAKRWDLTY